jgi:hypothetical protein
MNSGVSEFKSFLGIPPRQQELEEARGELLSVSELEGFAVAIFPWGGISLPGEFSGRLQELVGKKVGILRLEGYHIRDLDGDGHA